MKKRFAVFIMACLFFLLKLEPATASSAVPAEEKSGLPVETKTLHFSFPDKGRLWQSHSTDAVSIQSDEYWFQVSGLDLKIGVDVDLSAPGAMVRFSALARGKAKQGGHAVYNRSQEIDLSLMQVYRQEQLLSSAVESMTSEADLSRESLFKDSSLLQFNSDIGTGRLTLKSKQSLNNDDQYLVYVREPLSNIRLHLSAPVLSMLAGESFNFKARLEDSQQEADQTLLSGGTYTAYMVSPAGIRTAVSLKGNIVQGWFIQLPETVPESNPGALYSLYIEVVKGQPDDGLLWKRIAKINFALALPTAQLENIRPVFTVTRGVAANITLNVATASRYEVRGTIYGTDKKGKLRSIMQSHSAYWLQPGLQDIELLMDTDILNDSDLKAPYSLKNIQILDQGQLAVLASQPESS